MPRHQRAQAAAHGAASASPACGMAAAIPRCQSLDHAHRARAATARSRFFNGAVDIGQGSTPCCRRSPPTRWALPLDAFRSGGGRHRPDADAGKTSASRQTFVSGNAAGSRARTCAQRSCASPMPAPTRSSAWRWQPLAESATATAARSVDLADLAACMPDEAAIVLLGGEGTLGSADHGARCERPGRPLRHLRLRRADGGGGGRHGARHRKVLQHRRRARCRPRHQPDAGRGPDPRRHRPRPRPGADGGVHPRPHREPARLSDPHGRRHAARSRSPDRGCGAHGPVRRQGRRRAGADRHRARDPRAIRHATGRAHHARVPAPPRSRVARRRSAQQRAGNAES